MSTADHRTAAMRLAEEADNSYSVDGASAGIRSIAHSLVVLTDLLAAVMSPRTAAKEPKPPQPINAAQDPCVSVEGMKITVYGQTVTLPPADVRYDRIDTVMIRGSRVIVEMGLPCREPTPGVGDEPGGWKRALTVFVPARSRALDLSNVKDVRQ